MAAGTTDDLGPTVARFLDAIGWVSSVGRALTGSMASDAAWDITNVLRHLGAVTNRDDIRRVEYPTADGVSFARAALRTWRGGGSRTSVS